MPGREQEDDFLKPPFDDSAVANNQEELPAENVVPKTGVVRKSSPMQTDVTRRTPIRPGAGAGGIGVFGAGAIRTNVIKRRA